MLLLTPARRIRIEKYTYVTKTPTATMALLMPQLPPQAPELLYAAWVEKAEIQMTMKRPSTASIIYGLANLRVRPNRGVMTR